MYWSVVAISVVRCASGWSVLMDGEVVERCASARLANAAAERIGASLCGVGHAVRVLPAPEALEA